jgi:membrane-bound lytic murein transglycosylase A
VEYRAVAFADLPGWSEDRQGEALAALRRSCARLAAERPDWREACAAVSRVADDDHQAARALFETHFTPLRVQGDGADTGLITGYFEPEIEGALAPGGRYRVPLHALPAGAAPWPTRAAIDAGALDGTSVIAWLADPIDAFFLHIQGSGRVRLDDGRVMRVGYAGTNGHPYVAIGRVLIAEGALAREDVSMQSIRAWLDANPGEARRVMHANSSYVFFRLLEGEGPIGTEGVALTPGRSVAVDRGFVPLGLPVWVDAPDPLEPGARIRRLAIAQDTGGAIRGAVRADVFWGAGAEAAERAGRMREPGAIWVLQPRMGR